MVHSLLLGYFMIIKSKTLSFIFISSFFTKNNRKERHPVFNTEKVFWKILNKGLEEGCFETFEKSNFIEWSDSAHVFRKKIESDLVLFDRKFRIYLRIHIDIFDTLDESLFHIFWNGNTCFAVFDNFWFEGQKFFPRSHIVKVKGLQVREDWDKRG